MISRPPYAQEFREQIVELAKTDRTPSELSRGFGCSAQTITNWVRKPQLKRQAVARQGRLTSAERQELTHLRREFLIYASSIQRTGRGPDAMFADLITPPTCV